MARLTKKQETILKEFLFSKEHFINLLKEKFNIDFSSGVLLSNLQKLENVLTTNKVIIEEDTIQPLSYIIGEVIIDELGGLWTIGTAKKDSAYNKPIILNWGNDEKDHIRLFPEEWIRQYNRGKLRLKTFSKMILQNK